MASFNYRLGAVKLIVDCNNYKINNGVVIPMLNVFLLIVVVLFQFFACDSCFVDGDFFSVCCKHEFGSAIVLAGVFGGDCVGGTDRVVYPATRA